MIDADAPPDGRITTEAFDRVFAIGIDRPKKLNGFSPKMLTEMAEAFTAFERDEGAWVGLLYAHGANFTAGLELGGAVLLVVPALAGIGALVLAIVMVGAILAHTLVLGGSAVPAMVLLVATLTIAWFRRAQTPSLVRV